MVTLPRLRCCLTIFLLSSGVFLIPSRSDALTENQIREQVQRAEEFEKQSAWDRARDIYESLLNERDPGLNIRDRYNHSVRRNWQIRRHQDVTYRKEVLSIETGAALRLYKIIARELLDRGVDKKKLDPARLFRKGMEEFEAALGSPVFLEHHLPNALPGELDNFRALLRKTWGKLSKLSREEAVNEINEVAMAAEAHLNLSATVVTMEFACGACYAIDEFSVYLTPAQLRELTEALARSEPMAAPTSVSAGMRAPDMLANVPIGYIHINGFTESTVQELESALALLNPGKDSTVLPMKALILDLRGNSGGLFESAIESARRFLSTGIITSTVHEDAKLNFVYHAKNSGALTIPVVVIVDGDTASAAEVLAGALKDNGRATLIGQKTFGKGCTQTILKLPSALGGVPTGGLKVTVARFFSPKGLPYCSQGVTPHIVLDEALAQSQSNMGDDAYLRRAVEEINRMMLAQK